MQGAPLGNWLSHIEFVTKAGVLTIGITYVVGLLILRDVRLIRRQDHQIVKALDREAH